MSAGNWNGHALPERRDTVASRCADIIERGMARLRLERVPVGFTRLVTRGVDDTRRSVAQQRRIERVAAVVAEWRKTPVKARSLAKIAAAHKISEESARRGLIEVGLLPGIKSSGARSHRRLCA